MVLWKFLLIPYFRSLLISLGSFLGILLVSRFREIAKFASVCNDQLYTLLFALYQIPFILPMAIPLSCFFSSFLLSRTIHNSSEYTALSSSGISPSKIFTPLLYSSIWISLFTFYLSAELAPHCLKESKNLLTNPSLINPIQLLQKFNSNNFYSRMDQSSNPKTIENPIFVFFQNEPYLVTAEKVWIEDDQLFGENVDIISYIPDKNNSQPIVYHEQVKTSSASLNFFTNHLTNRTFPTKASLMPLKFLLVETLDSLQNAPIAFAEILKRISFASSVLSLTYLGFVFGKQNHRNPSKLATIFSILLILPLLSTFFWAKVDGLNKITALLLFSFPHLLILTVCHIKKRISL
jgi:lipopolysaccharide export system permease protein